MALAAYDPFNRKEEFMKRFVFSCAALLMLLGVAGCSSHYELTMQDGTKVITVGKPSLDESTGMVTYETRFDGEKQVPQSEVKEYVKKPY
ncbi:hypothetical protein SOASR030_14710 [Leminorella grimontii]|uniref:Lipoprotein YgdI/YgdR-like SH3-like domain-containing protein n=2 Tax=Leminorella grimontii TaxID=82981 RepID=A0AAV5N116_9GAMM|nr:hypothetical protein SOASR030_14710 [Leminorella grimontii]GKX58779.1 hypothetical protein SOASR031_10940 [Leminorella grimontii]